MAQVKISKVLTLPNVLEPNHIYFVKDSQVNTYRSYITDNSGNIVDLAVNNYAPLVDGIIPPEYLPDYVDDVLEYPTRNDFPTIGVSGKIYIAKDTNKIYRWESNYILISNGPISLLGEAEDGNYNDGLFLDLNTNTPVGTFADRVNEVLKSLCPSPAPNLNSINLSSTGVNGFISFNNSNQPSGYTAINGIGNLSSISFDQNYSVQANRYGIFGSSLNSASGLLASNISQGSGVPTASYPANSFGDGDLGTLKLYVNNNSIPIHTVDLSVFNSGVSVNSDGNGFNLSAATSIKFPAGDSLDLFKYRTGTWNINNTAIRNGWNYIRVIHTVNSIDRVVSYIDFFRDSNSTPITFSAESISNLSLTGSKYLSGVNYYTGGTATYNITINDIYRNTYVASNAVSFNTINLNSVSSISLTPCNGDFTAAFTTNRPITISSNLRLNPSNSSISIRTNAIRVVGSGATSNYSTISNILLDSINTNSSNSAEYFCLETFRLPSNIDFDFQNNLISNQWNSNLSILTGTGYGDGLQFYNGSLVYPSINYSTILNGPTSNVNYSTATGSRNFYRYFIKNGAANFTLTVNGSGTIRSNSYNMTNGSNDFKIDIKLPNSGGEGTGWLDVTQLFATNQWLDGNGCLSSGTFILNTGNLVTVGTKNTGSSSVNGKIILRVRVPQNWTGNISSILLI